MLKLCSSWVVATTATVALGFQVDEVSAIRTKPAQMHNVWHVTAAGTSVLLRMRFVLNELTCYFALGFWDYPFTSHSAHWCKGACLCRRTWPSLTLQRLLQSSAVHSGYLLWVLNKYAEVISRGASAAPFAVLCMKSVAVDRFVLVQWMQWMWSEKENLATD